MVLHGAAGLSTAEGRVKLMVLPESKMALMRFLLSQIVVQGPQELGRACTAQPADQVPHSPLGSPRWLAVQKKAFNTPLAATGG